MKREFDFHLRRMRGLLSNSPKTVALVGNGPSACGLAELIDKSDFVVRINTALHCGAAGVRTDALAIINWSYPADGMTSGWSPILPLALDSAREIWLPMPPEEMKDVRKDRADPLPPPAYQDFSEQIIKKLVRGRVYTKFPPKIWRDLKVELRKNGARREHMASTGSLVLAYLVRVWPRSKITLFGFTHEGWAGHPWEAEARWVASLRNVHYARTQ